MASVVGLRSIDLDRMNDDLAEPADEDDKAAAVAAQMVKREEELRRLRAMRSQELETYWIGVANGDLEPTRRVD